jgi:hypothetical protein
MDKNKAMQEVDKFDSWLKDKIKNVHYASHSKMSEAYAKVYANSISLQKQHELNLII